MLNSEHNSVKSKLGDWIRQIFDSQYDESDSKQTLVDMVEAARQDWLNAQKIYNEVSDSDLVDYAAYTIQAAEKKYVHLLKQVRQQNSSQNIVQ